MVASVITGAIYHEYDGAIFYKNWDLNPKSRVSAFSAVFSHRVQLQSYREWA